LYVRIVLSVSYYASRFSMCDSSKTRVVRLLHLFHPVSNFNTLRHQFESGKTQKTAGRRLSVAIGNTKVTIAQIAITIIQV
jgi:type II secretory pathway component PulF